MKAGCIYLGVSLHIVVSKDNVVGGTRCGWDDIEGILGLEAPQVDAAGGGVSSSPNKESRVAEKRKGVERAGTWCIGRMP